MTTPSPLNPLGLKGAGEGGTIPAIAALLSAVENALAPFGVHIASTDHADGSSRSIGEAARGRTR